MTGFFISPEARGFMAALEPAPTEPITIDNVAERREATRAMTVPLAEQTLQRHQVTLAEHTIGGVPCLAVTPARVHPSRTLLYCFGGGFVVGSPFEDLTITAFLAEHTGATVQCIDYRLAPEHPYPAALEDGMAVYRALAARDGMQNIALAGESAGGGLALALLQRARQEGLPLPVSLALLSPWCDLTDQGDSIDAGRDPMLLAAHVRIFAQAYASGRSLKDPGVSPLYGDFDQSFPRTLITSGTRDLLLSGCTRLSRKMRAAGIAVELRVWESMWHVFEFFAEVPEGQDSLGEIAGFLNAQWASADPQGEGSPD